MAKREAKLIYKRKESPNWYYRFWIDTEEFKGSTGETSERAALLFALKKKEEEEKRKLFGSGTKAVVNRALGCESPATQGQNDADLHYERDRLFKNYSPRYEESEFNRLLGVFNALCGAYPWAQTNARVDHVDEFGAPIKGGDVYFSRRCGGGFHQVDRLSLRSMETLFSLLLKMNPVLEEVGEIWRDQERSRFNAALMNAYDNLSARRLSRTRPESKDD